MTVLEKNETHKLKKPWLEILPNSIDERPTKTFVSNTPLFLRGWKKFN